MLWRYDFHSNMHGRHYCVSIIYLVIATVRLSFNFPAILLLCKPVSLYLSFKRERMYVYGLPSLSTVPNNDGPFRRRLSYCDGRLRGYNAVTSKDSVMSLLISICDMRVRLFYIHINFIDGCINTSFI